MLILPRIEKHEHKFDSVPPERNAWRHPRPQEKNLRKSSEKHFLPKFEVVEIQILSRTFPRIMDTTSSIWQSQEPLYSSHFTPTILSTQCSGVAGDTIGFGVEVIDRMHRTQGKHLIYNIPWKTMMLTPKERLQIHYFLTMSWTLQTSWRKTTAYNITWAI